MPIGQARGLALPFWPLIAAGGRCLKCDGGLGPPCRASGGRRKARSPREWVCVAASLRLIGGLGRVSCVASLFLVTVFVADTALCLCGAQGGS